MVTEALGLRRGFLLREDADRGSTSKKRSSRATPTILGKIASEQKKKVSSSGMKAGFLLGNKNPSKRISTKSKTTPGSSSSSSTTAFTPPKNSAVSVDSQQPRSKSGFTKGFLESKNAQRIVNTPSSRRKEVTLKTSIQQQHRVASQDLLAFEDSFTSATTNSSTPTSTMPSFMRIENHNDLYVTTAVASDSPRQRSQQPLKSVADPGGSIVREHKHEKNSDLQYRTPPSRPLISILGEEEQDAFPRSSSIPSTVTDIQNSEQADDKHNIDILFQEKSTTFYPGGRQEMTEVPILSERPRPTVVRQIHPSVTPRPLARIDTQSSKNLERNDDYHPVITASNSDTLFLDFQQELTKIKWDTDDVYHKTEVKGVVEKWTPLEISWAWEWLFSLSSKSTSTNNGTLILSLLQYHPSTIRRWLVSETLQDRARALQLVRWIKDFIVAQPKNGSSQCASRRDCVDIWRHNVFPYILILAEQPCRTVLAQEAWTTCTMLVSWSCKALCGAEDYPTEHQAPIFLNWMDCLDRLLKTLLKWKQEKKTSAKKNQALIPLIENWIQVNDRCRQDQLLMDWQKQVIGILLEDGTHYWGGLSHLFCREISASRRAAAQDDLSNAWNLLKQPSLDPIDQGMLLRGVLAHLSTAKHLVKETQDAIIANVLGLLLHIKNLETCEVALSILSFIWSDSNGLPADLRSHVGPGLPKSMELLLDAVSISTLERRQIVEKTPLEAIAAFVAKCILDVPDAVKVVEDLISRQNMGAFTVLILFHIIGLNRVHNVEEKLSKQNMKRSCLNEYVQDKLLDEIPTSSFVRKCLTLYDHAVLGEMDDAKLSQTVPKLLKMLRDVDKKQDELSNDIESSVVSMLTWILESFAVKGELSTMVNEVVKFLTKQSVISDKLCEQWRFRLLNQPKIPDNGFAELLSAATKAITCHPSNVELLGFFGALVGENIPQSLRSFEGLQMRMMLAVEILFEFFSRRMDEMENDERFDIFARLSPLLILRRVPVSYFGMARNEAGKRGNVNFDFISQRVGDRLTRMLVVDVPSNQIHVTPEERRLAAEVAGRALNFGQHMESAHLSASSCRSWSTFHCICVPTFGGLIKETVRVGGQLESDSIWIVRKARAALHAACHSILNIDDSNEEAWNHEYLKTASFALYVVEIPVDDLEDHVSREVVQLQTCCIEFFAICLTQTLAKRRCCPNPSSENLGFTHDQATMATSEPWKPISDAIFRILIFGNLLPAGAWICAAESQFLTCSSAVAAKKVSIQAKTCLWNAMILVAQRCNDKDGSLTAFGKSILPLIAAWGNEAKSSSDGDLHHSMCAAAAMQTVYTIITRSRSLESLEGHKFPKATYVRMFQDWALHAAKKKSPAAINSGDGPFRMAALKLILALVAMDTIGGDDDSPLPSCLESGQLIEILSVVEELSKHDPDNDIRALAGQILSVSNQS